MKKKKRWTPSTTHIILLSFLLAILVGSLLLSLPISTRDRQAVPYIDALFTATTATCVTGLVTLTTATTWSFFGQAVILLLIQIGGLGVITVMAGLMVAIHRKMGIRDSQLIGDAFNLNSLSELSAFIRKVILGTLLVEGTGALLYMTVFIPAFGVRGIWISLFNAVSAFCNAGIDIIGETSLCDYATHPLINIVTSLLIILGGLGYIVWWDLIRVMRGLKTKGLRCFRELTLHSKLVLTASALLIFVGGVVILVLEYHNPLTIGGLSFFDKLQVSFFQSVTTRTAGFATVPQESLTGGSVLVCLLMMFVGGSPVGTAGGVKTVTVAVLMATALSTIRGRNEATLFNRRLAAQTIRKAVAVTGMSFLILFLSSVLLCAVTNAPVVDVIYETVSATATVGLTRALTPSLTLAGKIIVIVTMYAGRIGPISLAVAFASRKEIANNIKDPTEAVVVG